jgi:hypothetical protein
MENDMNEDPKHSQQIPAELIEQLRDQFKISTGKIKAIVVEQLRAEWANQIAWHEKKIEEHDNLITIFRRKFGVKKQKGV